MGSVAASPKPARTWHSSRIRLLRGKRTQSEFGRLLGVTKNTVWRWESGRVRPGPTQSRRLARLATREDFERHFQVVGSIRLTGDIEEGSRKLARHFQASLRRTARRLMA